MSAKRDILVIGFGNELRRDDGIGPYVARRIEARQLPIVRTVAVHQLTPELAEDVSRSDVVLFVDANRDPQSELIRVQRIELADAPIAMWHALQPAGLVTAARILFGRAPDAWLVTIAGDDFTFGEQLSPGGRQRADAATDSVEGLITDVQQHRYATTGARDANHSNAGVWCAPLHDAARTSRLTRRG